MYPTWTQSNNSELKRIALKFWKDTNTHVKSAATSDDDRPRKKEINARKVDRHERKKSIEVADNANIARKLMVTTPITATELDVNEILVVGCSESDPPACQSACMKIYRSRNASYNMSKLKKKIPRIEVAECAKAEANTFTIENQLKLGPPLIFVPLHGLHVLIAEVDKEWIPKDLLNMRGLCFDHLKCLKDEKLFGVTLSNDFGNWFTYKNLEV